MSEDKKLSYKQIAKLALIALKADIKPEALEPHERKLIDAGLKITTDDGIRLHFPGELL